MKEVKVKELSLEAFSKYGSYANMINPDTIKIGAEPIEFFRDIVKSNLGNATQASFSVCRVSKRPNIINVSEYHNTSCEVCMPIDGDVLMHVAPAVPQKEFPVDLAEVFYIPKGTIVIVDPGVWHHGPYTVDTDVVNCLVALPERLYMNDCYFYDFPEEDYIKIISE
jgi:ureidoglycolate lyase